MTNLLISEKNFLREDMWRLVVTAIIVIGIVSVYTFIVHTFGRDFLFAQPTSTVPVASPAATTSATPSST